MTASSVESTILVAGGRGMVGSTLVRPLQAGVDTRILAPSRSELDVLDQAAVHAYLAGHWPHPSFIDAAKVKAILEGLAALPPVRRAQLLPAHWGDRRPAELYWRPPPSDLSPGLPRAGDGWSGTHGPLQHVFIEEAPDLSAPVDSCGSVTVILAAYAQLCARELPERSNSYSMHSFAPQLPDNDPP